MAYEAPLGIRSPRALLMGDAFTAVADDEYTLFYNPAALGRTSRDFTFTPVNPAISATNVLGDIKKYQDFPDTPSGVASLAMNQPLHAGVNMVPGFKLFNVGFSYFASESLDVLLRNRIHPTMDVDYRSDRGFALGTGIPLGSGRISGKKSSGHQTNLGVGVKYIKRRGLLDSLALTGTDLLNQINSGGTASDIVKGLGVVEGDAWGFDAALEHVVRSGPSQLVVSLSAMDITKTKFDVPKNSDNKTVANNRDQVNLGMAWMLRSTLFHSTFSMDVRSLNQQVDFLQRFRFGVELGVPVLSVLGGWNAGYYSYGVGLNLGIMKLMAGFYGVEAGNAYHQTESSRMILYLSLFDFSFDA